MRDCNILDHVFCLIVNDTILRKPVHMLKPLQRCPGCWTDLPISNQMLVGDIVQYALHPAYAIRVRIRLPPAPTAVITTWTHRAIRSAAILWRHLGAPAWLIGG
jgi:hypothetical protein